MSTLTSVETIQLCQPHKIFVDWRRILRSGENLMISFALAAMVLIPLAEAFLRKTFETGISGATSLVQHFTLMVGMLGGAIAAREGRLLSLSSLETLLKGRFRSLARVYSSLVAAAVSVFLCVASFQFMLAEKEAAKILAYRIPVWTIQLILPVGFALVALRILWHTSEKWLWRAVTALLTGAVVWAGVKLPISPGDWVIPALLVLLAATVLGAPIFATLGGAALLGKPSGSCSSLWWLLWDCSRALRRRSRLRQ